MLKQETEVSQQEKVSTTYFSASRMPLLFFILQFFLTVSLLNSYINSGLTTITPIALVITIFLNFLCFSLYSLSQRTLAKTLFVLIYTALLSVLVINNGGMYDSAAFAYMSVIAIAAILLNGASFICILLLIVALVIGISAAEVQGWIHYQDREITWEQVIDYAAIFTATGFCLWLISQDLKLAIAALKTENQEAIASKKKIQKLVNHDGLTGCYNRRASLQQFTQLNQLRQPHQEIIILYVDCDNFKEANDCFGHSYGDKILIDISQRLEAYNNGTGFVGRLGGDEFILVTLVDKDLRNDFAQEVMHSFRQSNKVDSINIDYSVSIGASYAPNHGTQLEELIVKADLALYQIKKQGKNELAFYNSEIQAKTQEHIKTIAAIRQALSGKEFEIYFQPKFSTVSKDLVGAEALLRWENINFKHISTENTILAAEQSGAIISIGEYALEQACRACQQWHKSGFPELTVAINISNVQLLRSNLVDIVKRNLIKFDLLPRHIELEITESQLVNQNTIVTNSLVALNQLGIELSIDDFGTGYSNFDYLRFFNAKKLKIDTSFIINIRRSDRDKAIVKAMIQMAKSLSMETVAEGVETEECLQLLEEMGCDYFQGHYYSHALPTEEFQLYINQWGSNSEKLA